MAAMIVSAAPASAKPKEKTKPAKKQVARTWKVLVDHVMKKGGEDSIKAPSARTLGYDSNEVFAKSLGLDQDKSKDGREHTIFIVYEKDDKGALIPKEMVLGSIRVTGDESEKRIDSYRIRTSLEGTIIRGMHASGIVGEVVQESLQPDSPKLLSIFKNEKELHLNTIDLTTLTP